MPMVGDKNFEPTFFWPTKKDLLANGFQRDTRLTSISFKEENALQAIQLSYTDGIQSPFFETPNSFAKGHGTEI